MQIQLVSMSQDLSFEDGEVTHFVLLRVPSGQVVRAVVSEESTRILVESLATLKTGAAPVQQQPSPTAEREVAAVPGPANEEEYEEGASVFGGDGGSGVMWTPPTEDAPRAPVQAPDVDPDLSSDNPDLQLQAYRAQQRRQAEAIKRGGTHNGRHIPKDDQGYPILPSVPGADPGELLGTGSVTDEDGVGQI